MSNPVLSDSAVPQITAVGDSVSTGWLPSKLDLSEFQDIDALEIASYTIFQNDWPATEHPQFKGNEIRIHRHSHVARGDRWQTYWHAVTEGSPETDRNTPIQDRLERIPWCKPVIENETSTDIKVWENTRGRDKHICIWFDRINYIVILKQCFNHVLLKTTYSPRRRRKQQLHKEYARYKKTGRAQ